MAVLGAFNLDRGFVRIILKSYSSNLQGYECYRFRMTVYKIFSPHQNKGTVP
jgi:hypothetical protein